jgi:O-antigen/teichoic acid export membrane protein
MGIARSIARNTAFEFLTEISELGVAFVTGIVLTRGLGTEKYGLYALALWLFSLTTLLTNLGIGEMSRRFIPEAIGRRDPNEPAGFVRLAFSLRLVISLVVCLVVLVSSGYWTRLSGSTDNRLIFVLVAVTVIPSAFSKALEMIFKGFQRFDYSLYISLAMHPLRLILIIIFVTLGFGVATVIIIQIAASTVSVLFGLVLLRRLVPLKRLLDRSLLSRERRNEALKYALTLTGILVLGYLFSQQTETYLIGLYLNVEDVGFYTLAFKIGTLIGVFPAAFGYVLLPAITEQFGRGDTGKMKKIYLTAVRYLMMLALPMAAGGIVLADSIITVFYGADYQPAIIIFQIISLPIAIASITAASDAVIRGMNRPGFILVTMIFLSILNIGLSVWLVPRYGTVGAAIASSVPLVLALPVYIIFTFKKIGLTWPTLHTIKVAAATSIMGMVVYIVHNYLGLVMSLVICIPLGAVIYVAALFALKVIKAEDLSLLRGIERSMPGAIKKSYVGVLNLVEKLVVKKNLYERDEYT